MSRSTRCCVALLLALAPQSSAARPPLLSVTVNVFNDARIAASVLATAEQEASRIFDAAHIEIRWIACTHLPDVLADASCGDPRRSDHLNLRIVSASRSFNEDIFGIAFLDAEGTGIYSDVFYESIEKLRTQLPINPGNLLGHVMAHEIGHLLVGSHAHSAWGIMCAKWHTEELQRVRMGTLFFTAEQANSMHRKLLMSRRMTIKQAAIENPWADAH